MKFNKKKSKQDYNAADPKQIKEKREESELKQEQHLQDIRKILKTPEGIRVFSRILERGRMFSTSFTGNSATFFNEGARNLALQIFSEICEASPDKIASIILNTKEIENG